MTNQQDCEAVGPWEVDIEESADNSIYIGVRAPAPEVLDALKEVIRVLGGEAVNDELLEALKQIVIKAPGHGPLWHGSDEMVAARDAIAKAKGETNEID